MQGFCSIVLTSMPGLAPRHFFCGAALALGDGAAALRSRPRACLYNILAGICDPKRKRLACGVGLLLLRIFPALPGRSLAAAA